MLRALPPQGSSSTSVCPPAMSLQPRWWAALFPDLAPPHSSGPGSSSRAGAEGHRLGGPLAHSGSLCLHHPGWCRVWIVLQGLGRAGANLDLHILVAQKPLSSGHQLYLWLFSSSRLGAASRGDFPSWVPNFVPSALSWVTTIPTFLQLLPGFQELLLWI